MKMTGVKVTIKKFSKKQRDKYLTLFMVIALYGIIQALVMTGNVSSLMQGLLVPICTYSIVAIGLNLCVGYLGELSIGHAGFMCVGAFTGALSTKLLQDAIPNEILLLVIAIVVGTLFAALFGFLIGIPVLRLKGDYLAIVTLAFGEIIKNVINVLYVGRDAAGLHFAFGDNKGIKLAEGGK